MKNKKYLSFPNNSIKIPHNNKIDHSITFVIILFVIVLFSSIQFFAQEKKEIIKNNNEKNIFSPQAGGGPSIYFKNSVGLLFASINDENDGSQRFGSLSLMPASRSTTISMANKLWINSRGDLMYGGSPLAGWWTLSGSILTFPTGLMVLGTSANPASTPVLNVLGRATMKSLKLTDGNEGDGKVLVSDANGVGTWQELGGTNSIDGLIDGKGTANTKNVYLGSLAGENDNNQGNDEGNVGIGYSALADIDPVYGIQNTAIGYESMLSFVSGSKNTAVGLQSLSAAGWGTDSEENTAIGSNSMGHVYNGNGNTALGYQSLLGGEINDNANVSMNTAIGSGALRNNTTGSGNVAIGFEAGKNSSGDDKLYIHNGDAGTNSLIYGDFNAAELTINGKLLVTQGIYGNVYNPSGWPSDIRFKKNVETLSNSLDKVLKLRGVAYYWRKDEFPNEHFNDKKQIGVIAQEVEEIFPELVETRDDGYKGVDYAKFSAVLIEAMKEQQKTLEKMKDEILELKNFKKVYFSKITKGNN